MILLMHGTTMRINVALLKKRNLNLNNASQKVTVFKKVSKVKNVCSANGNNLQCLLQTEYFIG